MLPSRDQARATPARFAIRRPDELTTAVRCSPETARRPCDDHSGVLPGTLKRTSPRRSATDTRSPPRPAQAISAPSGDSAGGEPHGVASRRAGPERTRAIAYCGRCVIESRARYGISNDVPSAENTGGAGGASGPARPATTTLRSAVPDGAIMSRHGPERLLQNANALPVGDVASATSAYGLRERLRGAAPGASA